ncbi:hypothetical protein Nepgr_003963 [Nepenthes gracilis]|uniref:Uncharacterized protein n=1 Tax=Nepenthes gracilis TaxID=150966 RepID=A0AAD3S0L7_NEPGR|nr:hypothetical protein Nepgr_003963 [Nepenthes gracilis]
MWCWAEILMVLVLQGTQVTLLICFCSELREQLLERMQAARDAMGVLLSYEAKRMSPRPVCTWLLLAVPWWWFWPNHVEAICSLVLHAEWRV